MLKKIGAVDLILIFSAFISLIVAEYYFFQGFQLEAIFIGLWVPSILGFACLLRLIKGGAR